MRGLQKQGKRQACTHLVCLCAAPWEARRQRSLQDAMPQVLQLLVRDGVTRIQTLRLQVLGIESAPSGRVCLPHVYLLQRALSTKGSMGRCCRSTSETFATPQSSFGEHQGRCHFIGSDRFYI